MFIQEMFKRLIYNVTTGLKLDALYIQNNIVLRFGNVTLFMGLLESTNMWVFI